MGEGAMGERLPLSLYISLSFPYFERKSQNFLAVSIKKCIFAADL